MDAKQKWLKEAPTEALERCLARVNPDHEADLENYPLADRVHITTVGQVFLKDIRKELRTRGTNE